MERTILFVSFFNSALPTLFSLSDINVILVFVDCGEGSPVAQEDQSGQGKQVNRLSLTVWDCSAKGIEEHMGCLLFPSPRLFINKSDRWWSLEPLKESESVSGQIRLNIHYRKV